MHNSSGIDDDDLPNQAIFQTFRGVIFSGAMRISPGLLPPGSNLSDMEFQIHCIETEAYSAVLRAFFAQSDVLSWGKEGLITELRKELRVSDVEHREILGKINSDESIKSLREQRKVSHDQLLMEKESPRFDPSMGHIPCKKLKIGNIAVSASPKLAPCAQPSPAAIPFSMTTQVRDGKRCGDGVVLSPQVNVKQTVRPAPPNMHVPHAGKSRGSLIVQTSKKGSVHSGFASTKKPGSDIIEIRATDKLIHEGTFFFSGTSSAVSISLLTSFLKSLVAFSVLFDNVQVGRVCRSENPDPAQVEKAKFILKEHERALMCAIGKLADISDGDDSPNQKLHRYSNEEQQMNACRYDSHKQFGRTRGHCSEDFGKDRAGSAGIPFIDVQDDDYNEGY